MGRGVIFSLVSLLHALAVSPSFLLGAGIPDLWGRTEPVQPWMEK